MNASARLLLCTALGALCWALANLLRGSEVVDAALVLTCLVVWLAGTFGLARYNLRPLLQVAEQLDRVAGTRDRFQTALDFSHHSNPPAFEQLALDECESYARDFPLEQWLPVAFPRFALWALVPVTTIALLWWHAALTERANRPDAAAREKVEGQAKSLEQIAADLAKAAELRGDEELARIAREMQERAARLKDRAPKDREADKLALREISALEAMLREMQQAARSATASPEELAALAEALERTPDGKDAADSLKRGEMEAAGRQLEELLQKLKQRGDAAKQMDELVRSMQEKVGKLTSDQKNEIARQMEQAAQAAQAGQSEKMQQLLQRLADLLKQSGKGKPSQPSDGKGTPAARIPLDEKTLQELINALEKLKQSDGADKDASESAARALLRLPMPNAERHENPAGGKPGDPNDQPGAQKGDLNDPTASRGLFADKPIDARPAEGPAKRIEGAFGDGTSLQEFMQSAGAGGKSSRAYRELYGVMAPAAQDAVEQENIPLGSRLYIRRYFESIRPAE